MRAAMATRFHCLATDYDGTLAHDGIVEPSTVQALERLKASGRRLVMVTGRELEDLSRVFSRLDLFEHVVAENGAVLFTPATGTMRALADPPPAAFGDALAAAGVQPLSRGHVIVATGHPHEVTALELIREQGLELQVIFNKGAVMILPSGVNKATGLRVALDELGLARHNTVGVGDAENDHAFLSTCGCAVAVAGALPALREKADLVTQGDAGAGVEELCARLLADDLSGLRTPPLTIGLGGAEPPLTWTPFDPPLLIAGSSGGGKSAMATGLLERITEAGHQFCLVDPEGDYEMLDDIVALGSAARAPDADEVMSALEPPGRSVAANLTGLALAERPGFFVSLASRLVDLRTRTGRPHWLIVDEAHHVLGASREPGLAPPLPDDGVILITVEPTHVAAAVTAKVAAVIALGRHPIETLQAFASAVGEAAAVPAPDLSGDPGRTAGLFWRRGELEARRFHPWPSDTERRRHRRKYAEGDLGACSFYFRGPHAALNLRAQNLQVFAELAAGVDEETWDFHLRRGDIARWLAGCVKDPELADVVVGIAAATDLGAAESRSRVIEAIATRYTAPA
jgi:hydroxymethylpyrimidine pyrophosphatase-like HAD family hydrolase